MQGDDPIIKSFIFLHSKLVICTLTGILENKLHMQ